MSHDAPAEFAKSDRPGELTPYLRILLKGATLTEAQARAAFEEIASGQSHDAEIGAFLALLATRMPTVDEIVGAASMMRARVERVPCRTAPPTAHQRTRHTAPNPSGQACHPGASPPSIPLRR